MKYIDQNIPGPTEKIAQWVREVTFDDIPEKILYEAKTQIMNIISAIFAGVQTEPGKIVLDTIEEWGHKDEATIIPTGKKTSVRNAIYANSALSMTLDYDDYVYPVHTGHSAVNVSLALTEKLGLSGKDLVLAQIIATEVEGRVGASIVMGVQNGQLCSSVHIIGAACAAGKLMGLNKKEIQNAIGIGMYQPNYGLFAGFMGSDAKVLTAAITATTGLEAAELAGKGLTGTSNILEDKTGFCENFAFAPVMSMFSGFGKTWLTETISYKPYPGCAYVDTLADCILKLVNNNNIEPENISEINIYGNILTYKMDTYSRPFMKGPESTQATLNFSVPFNASVAILDKELTPKQFTRQRIQDPRIWELAKKVNLYLNLPMTAKSLAMPPISTLTIIRETGIVRLIPFFREHLDLANIKDVIRSLFRLKSFKNLKGPRWKRPRIKNTFDLAKIDFTGYRMPLGTMVEIAMNNGTTYVESKEVPNGAAGHSREEKRRVVEDKFKREVGPILGEKKVTKALEIMASIEQADAPKIKELIALFCSCK